jgi:hypothetical protein
MAQFIKFREISIIDREEYCYVNPDQVSSVTTGQILEGACLMHMRSGESFLIDETPDRVLFKLGHTIG